MSKRVACKNGLNHIKALTLGVSMRILMLVFSMMLGLSGCDQTKPENATSTAYTTPVHADSRRQRHMSLTYSAHTHTHSHYLVQLLLKLLEQRCVLVLIHRHSNSYRHIHSHSHSHRHIPSHTLIPKSTPPRQQTLPHPHT